MSRARQLRKSQLPALRIEPEEVVVQGDEEIATGAERKTAREGAFEQEAW